MQSKYDLNLVIALIIGITMNVCALGAFALQFAGKDADPMLAGVVGTGLGGLVGYLAPRPRPAGLPQENGHE